NVQTKISVYEKERASLEKETKRLRERLAKSETDTGNYQDLVDEGGVMEGILRRIAAEEEALKLKMAEPKRVKVLDEGYSKPPSGFTRPLAAGMAGMGGLGLVLLAVSWWEFRARRIETVDEVIQGLGLKLVGAIPDLSHRWFGPRRGQDERSQHLFVESI